MQLPFRNNPQAGLAKAEAAHEAIKQRIVALQADREATLLASDDIGAVQVIDAKLAAEQSSLGVCEDRIAALRQAIREQERDRLEQAHQAGIAIVAKRLEKRVELAKKLDTILREFETVWHQLLDRSAVTDDWPPGVPLPLAEDLLDVRPLRDELGWRLYACGRPAWNRGCSVPPPKPAVGVAGMEPKGLIGATEAMGQSLLARLKNTRIQTEEAA
jgi:hypothetical protein